MEALLWSLLVWNTFSNIQNLPAAGRLSINLVALTCVGVNEVEMLPPVATSYVATFLGRLGRLKNHCVCVCTVCRWSEVGAVMLSCCVVQYPPWSASAFSFCSSMFTTSTWTITQVNTHHEWMKLCTLGLKKKTVYVHLSQMLTSHGIVC